MTDLISKLWADSTAAYTANLEESQSRIADCLLVGLCEIVRSSHQPSFKATAASLTGRGVCTVPGVGNAGLAESVVANGFLLHAGLADDAYEVAHHPGVTVIPAALATAETVKCDGGALLEALILGYEFSCRLADLFLPKASERGWRISAVLAPMVASAVAGAIMGGREQAIEGARLAACVAGGPLYPVNGQGDWRLQPALASAAGVLAAHIAGVRQSDRGVLEARFGLLHLIADNDPKIPSGATSRLPSVTFKRVGGPMYGQAVYDAIERLPAVVTQIAGVNVTVSSFANRYAAQGEANAESVASIRGLALRAIRSRYRDGSDISDGEVTVRGGDAVGPLEATVEITTADGQQHAATGSGDTRRWSTDQVMFHCKERVGTEIQDLAELLHNLEGFNAEEVVSAWKDLAVRAAPPDESNPLLVEGNNIDGTT